MTQLQVIEHRERDFQIDENVGESENGLGTHVHEVPNHWGDIQEEESLNVPAVPDLTALLKCCDTVDRVLC